jgi:hypothetical protein
MGEMKTIIWGIILLSVVGAQYLEHTHKHEDFRLAFTQAEERAFTEYANCSNDEIQDPNPLVDPNTFNVSASNLSTATKRIAVSGMSFCSQVNYTALLPIEWDQQRADTTAEEFYNQSQSLLERYDCQDFYPYKSCEPCKTQYKNWICGIMFPMACSNNATAARKLCKDVCYDVVRQCPVELGFFCPTDELTYSDVGTCNMVNQSESQSSSASRLRYVVTHALLLLYLRVV